MKRKLTILISLFSAVVLLCQASYAEIISVEKAQLVAKNLYFERVNLKKETVSYQNIKFNAAVTVTNNSTPIYYVFNCTSEIGFVIVSAESNAYPILAYSFESYYDKENLNESVKEIMDRYEKEILVIRAKNFTADDETTRAWEKYSATTIQKSGDEITSVGPLIQTTWNQSCYYNTLCPVGNGSYGYCNHVPVGCVATAMAQIMRYWSYPSTGLGSHSYSSMGFHDVDFSAQTYNWSAMPNSITEENAEVAKISYHAGVSVDMSYAAGGSSASTQAATNALKFNFNYSSTTQYVDKSSYTNVQWDILIRSNLIDSKPLIYRGSGGSGGHAFIVDGFDYPDHYHINWGWGGSHNGLFYLSSLNSGNGDFTQNQGAIINCYPSNISGSSNNINENNISENINIVPNPNNGNFSIILNNSEKGNFTIKIMDISSRVIFEKNINKESDIIKENFNLTDINYGFYFVSIEGNNFKSVKKFIVK